MPKQVALLIETTSVYGRDLLTGVLRYVRGEADWSINFEQGDLSNRTPGWMRNRRGDGIISRLTNRDLTETARRSDVRVVDLTDRNEDSPLPTMRSDEAAIGRMAAEHLLERGFRSFVFCGVKNETWSERREVAFVEVISRRGGTSQTRRDAWYNQATEAYDRRQERLAEWIRSLETPAGILGVQRRARPSRVGWNAISGPTSAAARRRKSAAARFQRRASCC
ncbi:MAG: substrate-binding domain-containing protein [Planctomycetota bacterium]